MPRGTLLLATVLAALGGMAAPGSSALASGGGGCGRPVTDAPGRDVVMNRFCFTPTILHAPVGEPVTWSNRDVVSHVVGGANMGWGSFEQLRTGDSVSYRFSEPGVYPYVCSWHPGMVGAVVVGGGAPGSVHGRLGTTSVRPVSEGDRPAARPKQLAPVSAGDVAGPWKAMGAIALGLFAVTLAAGLELRRRLEHQR
jgi:plastocyanin